MIWVIAYDVANDKRRSKVARILLHHGIRIQRSVYECELDSAEMESLVATISEVLDEGADVLHAFPTCDRCSRHRRTFGRVRDDFDIPFIVF